MCYAKFRGNFWIINGKISKLIHFFNVSSAATWSTCWASEGITRWIPQPVHPHPTWGWMNHSMHLDKNVRTPCLRLHRLRTWSLEQDQLNHSNPLPRVFLMLRQINFKSLPHLTNLFYSTADAIEPFQRIIGWINVSSIKHPTLTEDSSTNAFYDGINDFYSHDKSTVAQRLNNARESFRELCG